MDNNSEDEIDESFRSESGDRLIPFLRGLADSIENRQLIPTQLQSIGEFFMSYKFQEQAEKDSYASENQASQDNTESNDFSSEDLVKFVCLGWYIYCCLLKDNPNPIVSANNLD